MAVVGIPQAFSSACKILADPETVIRDAIHEDATTIAGIWYDGWRDAHLQLVPDALAKLRTLESFQERTINLIGQTRVAQTKDVTGFCICRADELYQMYVAPAGRGTGIAQRLIADAETSFAKAGIEKAWLACAIGNTRAMRFYENCGWQNTGREKVSLDTSAGSFELEILRYEKHFGS